MAKPKAWPARVREAVQRWREAVEAWRKLFPRVILRLDGSRYLNVKMPDEMTQEERDAEGWRSSPGWQPGPHGLQIGRAPRNAEDAREMGWVPAPGWMRGPTPLTRAAFRVVAASQALAAVGASPQVAVEILPLQRFRDALKTPAPSVQQLDLLEDARYVAEQIELRYPVRKADALPVLKPVHWKIVDALQDFGRSGALLSEITVTGCVGKTLQRRLHDLQAHQLVELIEGGRKWRIIGQSEDG